MLFSENMLLCNPTQGSKSAKERLEGIQIPTNPQSPFETEEAQELRLDCILDCMFQEGTVCTWRKDPGLGWTLRGTIVAIESSVRMGGEGKSSYNIGAGRIEQEQSVVGYKRGEGQSRTIIKREEESKSTSNGRSTAIVFYMCFSCASSSQMLVNNLTFCLPK